MAKAVAPFEIESSIQFTMTGGSMLYKEFSATPTDRKKYTVSLWIKNGDTSSYMILGTTGYSSFEGISLYQNKLRFQCYDYQGGGSKFFKHTTANTTYFAGADTWQHFVFVYDSTPSSPDLKIYVNGTAWSSWTTNANPAQNFNSHLLNVHDGDFASWHGSDEHQTFYIGNGYDWSDGTVYGINAKLAEIHVVDGQALDESSFGHDVGGTWTAKAYTGTHGNNGGHYKMLAGAIGTDSSASGNNLTVSGLADGAVSTSVVPPH